MGDGGGVSAGWPPTIEEVGRSLQELSEASEMVGRIPTEVVGVLQRIILNRGPDARVVMEWLSTLHTSRES